MEQRPQQVYLCPMHPEVRQPTSGKCPQCGMELLPQGTRFAMLRHMIKNPWLLIVMVVVMVALMTVPVLF